MTFQSLPEPSATDRPEISAKHTNRIKIFGLLLTLGGAILFAYFVYSVGIRQIAADIGNFGFVGFAVILAIFLLRIILRAAAWSLSVCEPYRLRLRDTIPAVIIGEALSSTIPLGILISGTAKAVAVRRKTPLVVGLSSVATENLFYSFTTCVLLILGAAIFAHSFALEETTVIAIDILIAAIFLVLLFLILMVLRQWHFASEACEWLYRRGWFQGILERGRMDVRLFENFIFTFYRRYPKRFLPICLIESAFHLCGVLETWFIIYRLTGLTGQFFNSFLLETISRLITIVFKLVPFLIGVDEFGAQFVADTVGLAVAIGITLAIIRKGRILFWTAIGFLFIIKRGLTLSEIRDADMRRSE